MTGRTVPTVTLRHGAAMPVLGLGTWPMDDEQAETVVADALTAGYRLIDTAENYLNETGVGRGIRASGVPRDEVFITTKFNKRWHGEDLVRRAFDGSAQRLGVEYVDLMLIHWPNPGQDRYVPAWRGLARLLDDGLVRAIGVSNFTPEHLERVITETGVVPDVNQIQLNPGLTREAWRAVHADLGIVTETWAPLGGDKNGVLTEPVVVEIAARHGRTPAQVVLRWATALGMVTIPRSTDPQRLRENLDSVTIELARDELAAMSALNNGEADAFDPEVFGH